MRDEFARDSLHRQLVSAFAVSLYVSLKTPVFPGFSASSAGGDCLYLAVTPELPRRSPFGDFAVRFPC